jgi:hypothetical protein
MITAGGQTLSYTSRAVTNRGLVEWRLARENEVSDEKTILCHLIHLHTAPSENELRPLRQKLHLTTWAMAIPVSCVSTNIRFTLRI